MKRIFFISPVKDWGMLSDTERRAIGDYVTRLEADGSSVHWPLRDTDQIDPIGSRILRDNREALLSADEVHIWWCKSSSGSVFDLGMWYGACQPKGVRLVLANPDDLIPTGHKSFGNCVREWSGVAA